MPVGYWDANKWVDSRVYYWDGYNWIKCYVKYWDGYNWVDCIRYTQSFSSSWTQSYAASWRPYETSKSGSANGIWRPYYSSGANNYVYHGCWLGSGGRWRGLWFLPYSDIQSALKGSVIKKISATIGRRSENHGCASAGPIKFWTHKYSQSIVTSRGVPALSGEWNSGIYFNRGTYKTITLPLFYAEWFRDNKAYGIALYDQNAVLEGENVSYAYFYNDCTLRITYDKGM